MDTTIRPVEWVEGTVQLIDQTQLPYRYVVERYNDWRGVAEAIRKMKVRGAPAIGIACGYGLALAAYQIKQAIESNSQEKNPIEQFRAEFRRVCEAFANTRPTAINLFWAIERMQKVVNSCTTLEAIPERILQEAHRLLQEDLEADLRLAEYGARFVENGFRILTICNTGALATGGYGTALGIIRFAHEQGKQIHVYACETRPRLQGMRLNAWELLRAGIPFTLIADNMAGYLMARGEIDCVIVGADRIVANGDTANKIGTYTLAVLAHHHGIPFYVAAPLSTLDLNTPSGDQIPIEYRDETEMTHLAGFRVAPEGAPVLNPAFDITPAHLITAIITEHGIASPPYRESLVKIVKS